MAPDDSTPSWSSEDQASLLTATELLAAGQYKRLAELLHQVQLAYDRSGDTIPAHVLILARRVCLACSQSQAEADWHQQACEEAAQREDKLRHQLTTLLDLVSERDLPPIPGEWDLLPDATPTALGPHQTGSSQPVESLSLWQRIQGTLRWRLGHRPVEAAVTEFPGQGPLPPTLETVDSRSLSPTEQADQVTPTPQQLVEAPEIPIVSSVKEIERATKLGAEMAAVSVVSNVHEAKAPLLPPDDIDTETELPTQDAGAAHALSSEDADTPVPPVAEEPESHDALPPEKPEEAGASRPPAAKVAQAPVPESPAEAERRSEPAEESGALPPQSIEMAEATSLTARGDDEEKTEDIPSLAIHFLGPFRVYQDDQPVEDWPSGKGKAILKFLVIHRARPVAKEVLMELFWPGAHPDAARNNLNVAIYGLRQALRRNRPSFSHVLYQEDCYLLNPDLQIWVDAEAFTQHVAAAREQEQRQGLAAAIAEYGAAEALYQGEFLEEDRYEDWPGPRRQSLQDNYLGLLERLSYHYLEQGDHTACASVCRKMLVVDACCEEAHRRLMRCYCRLGQRYLALRQYHLCAETLRDQLDLAPASATIQLHERIRSDKRV